MRKDVDHNTVYVSKQYYAADKARDEFVAGDFHWQTSARPDPAGPPLQVKVRHGPNLYNCRLTWHDSQQPHGGNGSGSSGGEAGSAEGAGAAATSTAAHGSGGDGGDGGGAAAVEATVLLDGNDQGLAAGQYAVFYQGGACLGSAVIKNLPTATTALRSKAAANTDVESG